MACSSSTTRAEMDKMAKVSEKTPRRTFRSERILAGIALASQATLAASTTTTTTSGNYLTEDVDDYSALAIAIAVRLLSCASGYLVGACSQKRQFSCTAETRADVMA